MYTHFVVHYVHTFCVLSIFMKIDNENLYENLPMQYTRIHERYIYI